MPTGVAGRGSNGPGIAKRAEIMMMMSFRNLLPALLLVAAVRGASAEPVITGLNSSELPRSGRVAIEGTGFGASGEVAIAGLSAWTSTWTETRIVAYVPETAPTGAAALHVIAGGELPCEHPLGPVRIA